MIGEAPTFIDYWIAHGYLKVKQQADKNKKWIEDRIADLKPWEGAELFDADINTLPKHAKVAMYAKGNMNGPDTLKILARQNGTLKTDVWHIIEFRPKQIPSGPNLMVVRMLKQQVEALKGLDLKPAFG